MQNLKKQSLKRQRQNCEKGEFPTRKLDPPKNRRVNFMPVGLKPAELEDCWFPQRSENDENGRKN